MFQCFRALPIVGCLMLNCLAGTWAHCLFAEDSAAPGLIQRHPQYQLQSDDVLRVLFPLSPEMNQSVTVQPDGYITMQSAGSVYVRGLTVPEAVAAVRKAYAHILRSPIVDIDLTQFQKPSFTVAGVVARPGQYELRSDTTVAEAIAIAGGRITGSARERVFIFRRERPGYYKVVRVDLRNLEHGKAITEDPVLHAGDMVYVPEKFISKFRKYVPYSVNAGTYLQPGPL